VPVLFIATWVSPLVEALLPVLADMLLFIAVWFEEDELLAVVDDGLTWLLAVDVSLTVGVACGAGVAPWLFADAEAPEEAEGMDWAKAGVARAAVPSSRADTQRVLSFICLSTGNPPGSQIAKPLRHLRTSQRGNVSARKCG
jgi:hypothetical protein